MKENDITNNRIFAELILFAGGAALLFVAIIIGLTSCNSSKRSTKHFAKALAINRTSTAGNCANTFPYKTEIKERTNTVYLKGDSIVTHDTATQVVNNEVVKYITKTIHQTDTVRKDSIIVINADGGPELAQCQGLLEQATKDKQKAIEQSSADKATKKIFMWWALISTLAVALLMALKLKLF